MSDKRVVVKSKKPRSVVRPRNNNRANVAHSQAQRASDFGRKVSPPSNPPDTTAQPWWPLIISAIHDPGDYTIDTLVKDFQSQLNNDKYTFNSNSYNADSGTPFRAQFRFLGVDVWNITGRIVSLTVWEIPEQTYIESVEKFDEKDQLGSWVDCGGASAFPSVGYRYPSSHHRRIYRPDPRYADKKIISTIAASGDKILVHLHINWKCDGYPKFSTVQQAHIPILRKLEQTNQKLVNINRSILEAQGDTGNAIVKGVKIGAKYVLPIIAAENRAGSAAEVAAIVSEKQRQSDILPELLARIEQLEIKLSEGASSSPSECEILNLEDPLLEDLTPEDEVSHN